VLAPVLNVSGGRRFECGPRPRVFVLPYRVHHMYHPRESTYCVVNFASNFLRDDFSLTSLQMEEASIAEYPELTPFIYQDFVHFTFSKTELEEIQLLLERLHRWHAVRTLGTAVRPSRRRYGRLSVWRPNATPMSFAHSPTVASSAAPD